MFYYKDTQQITELDTYKYEPPKYDKSTTDPTYYEPQATRIANMKKSASAMQGIFDYSGEEAKKFADKYYALDKIENAVVDPRFNSHLLQEEISQITTEKTFSVKEMVEDKKSKVKKESDEVAKAVKVSQAISKANEPKTGAEE